MKISILGVGRMGSFHAGNLRRHPAVTELRIYDADAARAAGLARELEARAVSSVDEAFAGADALVIVTPSTTHAPLIHRALDEGVPAFCEKPIATGLKETREVVDHVDRSQGILQVGFQRRFDAGFLAARQQIQDGRLGTIYSFGMISRDRTPPPDEYIPTSGGAYRDMHIHDFDALRWLFGHEPEELFVLGSTLGFDAYRGYGDFSSSVIALRLENGTLGTISGARDNPAGYDIRVDVFGSEDSLIVGLDPRTPTRSVEADGPALPGPAYPGFYERFGAAYRAELDHFLKLACGQAANPCTALDALQALRIAAAADLSAHSKRPVQLREIPPG